MSAQTTTYPSEPVTVPVGAADQAMTAFGERHVAMAPPVTPGKARRPEANQLMPVSATAAQRLLGPALVLVIWTMVTLVGWVSPHTLPSPGEVLLTFVELWHEGYLVSNINASLARAGVGLGAGMAGGVLLALCAGLTRTGEALFDGLVQIKRALPNLALIPLFIMWMGIGEAMKITVIALGVFVPIYINTHAALRDIDLRYVELAQTIELGRARFLRYIVLPSCLPGFFTGLRLAAAHAWTALVVVETINATSGIGYMISQARIYGQIEIVMAGLVLYAVLGFGTDTLIRTLNKRVVRWRQTVA